MPTLDMTRASVPTAVPISRKSVRLNDIDVVIPAGNDVGHFAEPSGALAQQEPETLSFLGSQRSYLGPRIWGQKMGFKYTRLAESERGVRLWLENVRYLYTPFQ